MIARRLAAAVTSGVAAAWLATGGCGVERPLPLAAAPAAVAPAAARYPPPTTPETAGSRPADRAARDAAPPPTAAATTGPRPTAPAEAAAAGGCDVNYSPCVPEAADVDCGNSPGQDGPRFVAGPIRITGVDVYQLDGAEHDGVACEASGR